jgi:hypothetical protein
MRRSGYQAVDPVFLLAVGTVAMVEGRIRITVLEERNAHALPSDCALQSLLENLPFPCADHLPWVDARHSKLYREPDSPAHGKTTAHGEYSSSTRRK